MIRNPLLTRSYPLLVAALVAAGCGEPTPPPPTAADAKAFVDRLDGDLREYGKELSAASWVQATYITPDTQLLAARANERFLEFFSRAVKESRRFDGVTMD